MNEKQSIENQVEDARRFVPENQYAIKGELEEEHFEALRHVIAWHNAQQNLHAMLAEKLEAVYLQAKTWE